MAGQDIDQALELTSSDLNRASGARARNGGSRCCDQHGQKSAKCSLHFDDGVGFIEVDKMIL